MCAAKAFLWKWTQNDVPNVYASGLCIYIQSPQASFALHISSMVFEMDAVNKAQGMQKRKLKIRTSITVRKGYQKRKWTGEKQNGEKEE